MHIVKTREFIVDAFSLSIVSIARYPCNNYQKYLCYDNKNVLMDLCQLGSILLYLSTLIMCWTLSHGNFYGSGEERTDMQLWSKVTIIIHMGGLHHLFRTAKLQCGLWLRHTSLPSSDLDRWYIRPLDCAQPFDY